MNVTIHPEMLIDGKLLGSPQGQTFDVINPATGEVIGSVADGGPAQLDSAVAAARSAFDTTEWSRDHDFRRRCLIQLHEALVANGDDLRALTRARRSAHRAC